MQAGPLAISLRRLRRNLYEVIDLALALPRAERAALLERLKESLEQPDVPGGIVVEPQDLVELGARYVFPKSNRFQGETVTLTAKPGPTLSMTWGAVAIADPWLPETAPTSPSIGMGAKDYPTAVTVITRTRADTGVTEGWPVAPSASPIQ